MQMLFNVCTKESNAVPVGKIRMSFMNKLSEIVDFGRYLG